MSLKDDVIRWLKDEDLEVDEMPVPQGAPVEWILNAVVKAPMRVILGVQKPKAKFDRLVMSMVVKIAEQHKAALNSLEQRERLKLMTRLLGTVTSLCPTCVIVFQPQLDNPDTIVVSKVLYDDEFQPSVIGNSVRLLVNEYAAIVSFFNSEVGLPKGSQESLHM